VTSLAAFRRAAAAGAGAGAATSSSAAAAAASGGGAGAGELLSRFLAGSKKIVRVHLHGCRFKCTDGSFVAASAEAVPPGAVLTADAARAAAFVNALASSASSSSSSSSSLPDGGGGGGARGGGGCGKKRTSQKKGGGDSPPELPLEGSFRGVCFGCDAWGKWDDFVDEMEFAKKKSHSSRYYD
jgi:hypothetical protein